MSASRAAQEAMVELYTRELRLPGLRKAYRELVRDAAQRGQDPMAFLAACLATELESRRQHRLAHRLHQARFPARKTLDAFDFSAVPELPKARVLLLSDGGFVKARENVLCIGPPDPATQ